ncbi:hypothetical protein EDC96DRAFT_568901 [Choanephora cucurbitarum]|nr:hypothetical protein EDC96DRAFT_568901 [Choanephora cucurbitarum]
MIPVLLREKKKAMINTASYMTVGTLTVISISSLFLLFMLISLVDDLVRVLTPKYLLDWTTVISHISAQLTHFAEWEKNKRAFWYSEDHPIYHQDKFHELISTVTSYMNAYVERKRRATK